MFGRPELKEALREIKEKEEKIEKLNKELKEVQLDKKMEEQEIKHLVKMEKEKNSLELEKEKVVLQKEAIETQMEQLKEHHKELLTTVKGAQKSMETLIYKEIIQRLPNVNVMLENEPARASRKAKK